MAYKIENCTDGEADYIIDMGPGGGKDGGRIVAVGTPEEIQWFMPIPPMVISSAQMSYRTENGLGNTR